MKWIIKCLFSIFHKTYFDLTTREKKFYCWCFQSVTTGLLDYYYYYESLRTCSHDDYMKYLFLHFFNKNNLSLLAPPFCFEQSFTFKKAPCESFFQLFHAKDFGNGRTKFCILRFFKKVCNSLQSMILRVYIKCCYNIIIFMYTKEKICYQYASRVWPNRRYFWRCTLPYLNRFNSIDEHWTLKF